MKKTRVWLLVLLPWFVTLKKNYESEKNMYGYCNSKDIAGSNEFENRPANEICKKMKYFDKRMHVILIMMSLWITFICNFRIIQHRSQRNRIVKCILSWNTPGVQSKICVVSQWYLNTVKSADMKSSIIRCIFVTSRELSEFIEVLSFKIFIQTCREILSY